MSKSKTNNLDIPGCWTFKPQIHTDLRGHFFEWFQDSTFLERTNESFSLAQANCSVSNKGVIRGIHFAKYPPGQAKFVTCFTGSVFDVLVDLRKKSPTFGKWTSVIIDSNDPIGIYVPSGVGHAFMALENKTTFVYLCDQRYNPENEFDISPFDKTLNISWPSDIRPILSEKDSNGNDFFSSQDLFPDM